MSSLFHALREARQAHSAAIAQAKDYTSRLAVAFHIHQDLTLDMRAVWASLNLPGELLACSDMATLVVEARSYGVAIPGAPTTSPALVTAQPEDSTLP
jgi:hypothetical protein